MHSSIAEKKSLRKTARNLLDNLSPEERLHKSKKIIERIVSLVAESEPKIALYYPIENEPDLLEIVNLIPRAAFALPVIKERNLHLLFRAYKPGDKLIHDKVYNKILEPAEDKKPVTPDILILPGLLFSKEGLRLGYGGGYFDRTLEALRALKEITAIGVCFDIQLVDNFPDSPHDQRMDLVISENALYDFRAIKDK